MDYLELSGTIWDFLGLSGTIWDYLGLSQTIWDYLGLSRTIWDYMGLSGTIFIIPGLSWDYPLIKAGESKLLLLGNFFVIFLFFHTGSIEELALLKKAPRYRAGQIII